MATADTETAIAIHRMEDEAHDYITKPFDLDEFVLSAYSTPERRRLGLHIKEYERRLEQKVEEQAKEIQRLFLGAMESLVLALEAKDKYAAGHSRRVAKIAVSTGQELGLLLDELEDLWWGALLHDVGKIAVDWVIQTKPGRLTSDEYRRIMIHTQVGVYIVRPVANDRIVEIVAHHHDRYDGTGLDQTVREEAIPLGARVVAVADTFDAITSNRPYRDALPAKEALAEIKRCTGSQLDPVVVSAFLKIPVAEILLIAENEPSDGDDT